MIKNSKHYYHTYDIFNSEREKNDPRYFLKDNNERLSEVDYSLSDSTKLGKYVVIEEDVKIGENAIVGVGSVVTKDVAANETVVGIPAKKIRKANENDSKT
jgi:acetyltransferase-like isoleucine patch superfamily enzyme